jgi:hypothetical protein
MTTNRNRGDRSSPSVWTAYASLACAVASLFLFFGAFVSKPENPKRNAAIGAKTAHDEVAPPALRHSALPEAEEESRTDGLPREVGRCGRSEREVDEIQLHVISWRRPGALRSLLDDLEASDYSGWGMPVPLYLHIDGESSEEVVSIADESTWTHGEKHLDRRDDNVGAREMWFSSLGSAAEAAGDNTLMITFEDDTAVSPGYFQWILAAVDKYGRNIHCRDANLMGFSLSPIRVEEMTKPFKRWDATREVGSQRTAFLSVLPSSWGAAYWSDRWKQFADFATVRMKPQYYDTQPESLPMENYDDLRLTPKELYIKNSRSNVWPNSWKRFMVDWMYARGLVMLYPCLPGEKGLATTLALPGEHTERPTSANYENPRIAPLVDGVDRTVLERALPEYKELLVRGLHLEPTTRENLASTGAKFLRDVRARCDYCNELLRAWARPWTCLEGDDDAFVKNNCEGLMERSTIQASHAVNPICAPDLYMPASFQMKTVPPSASQKRYLLFEPQFGGNNQLIAIFQARDVAKVLGRTLVIPPVFLPRVSEFEHSDTGNWPDTTKVLKIMDTDTPGLYSHPISFKHWLERNTTVSRILRIGRDAIFDSSTSILTDHILRTDGSNARVVPAVNMRHLMSEEVISIDDVKHLFGGCKDQVLAFDEMYFVHLNVGGKIGADRDKKLVNWANSVEFSPSALQIWNVVEAKVQEKFRGREYACYHVRLDDFLPMCRSLKDQGRSPYYEELLEEGYKCYVSPEEAKDEMLSLGLPAIVMTDDATTVEETLENQVETVSSGWVKRIIEDEVQEGTNKAEQELMSLLFEEELCAKAKVAVLNKFSTVSDRIASMRSASGKSYSHWKEASFGDEAIFSRHKRAVASRALQNSSPLTRSPSPTLTRAPRAPSRSPAPRAPTRSPAPRPTLFPNTAAMSISLNEEIP